jgi:hypothetical protein
MKTCTSCGSEVAEDALECLCGYSFAEEAEKEEELRDSAADGVAADELDDVGDEGDFSVGGDTDDGSDTDDAEGEAGGTEFPELSMEREEPTTKHCVFCGSEISAGALRCAHCAGFLPIAEGTIFKQYFFFLFASMAMAIGCMLPWERTFLKGNLTGADSIGGAFLLVLAIYGVVVSVWNIYHRKMIVWPVMLAALDGAILGIQRVVQITRGVEVVIPEGSSKFYEFQLTIKTYAQSYGPGLYLVTIFSLLVLFSVIVSVFAGAKQDARRKSEEREMRATSRKTRRS